MNHDFMSLARQYQSESINQPPDDLFWLARPSIRAHDALFLLANIDPSNTLDGVRSPQRGNLEVILRLMQEAGIEEQEKPYLQWLKWADSHPEIDFPVVTKRIKKILRAIDANTQPEADNAMPEELAIALDAWRSVRPHPLRGKAVKAVLNDWIQRHYPGLTKNSRERIVVVANWDKQGGAPATENNLPTHQSPD